MPSPTRSCSGAPAASCSCQIVFHENVDANAATRSPPRCRASPFTERRAGQDGAAARAPPLSRRPAAACSASLHIGGGSPRRRPPRRRPPGGACPRAGSRLILNRSARRGSAEPRGALQGRRERAASRAGRRGRPPCPRGARASRRGCPRVNVSMAARSSRAAPPAGEEREVLVALPWPEDDFEAAGAVVHLACRSSGSRRAGGSSRRACSGAAFRSASSGRRTASIFTPMLPNISLRTVSRFRAERDFEARTDA